MKKITLCCAAGMSTSILVERMKLVAEELDLSVEIEAIPASMVEKKAKDANVILIGPQVRYLEERIRKQMHPIPCAVIQPEDYGMMDGKKVLYMAIKIMQESY